MNTSAGDSPTMKERILRTSVELFLKKSFRGTSVKDITDAVNISKGALYWYFKSKDELLQTIIDRYEEDFLDRLIKAIDTKESAFTEIYKKYHKHISEYALKNRELCVLFTTLAAEMAGSGTPAEMRIKAVYAKYLHFIETLLELAKDEGLFPRDTDLSILAHTVVAIHNGILLQWYMNKPLIDGAALSRTYRDVVLFGIAGKTDRTPHLPDGATP
jgi:AcrR family transcriptional regulator